MTTRSLHAPPTAASVAALVDLDSSAALVRVAGTSQPLPQSPAEIADLATLLYVHLHAGNPGVFGADAITPDPELASLIESALPEAKQLVTATPSSRRPSWVAEEVRTVDVERVRVAVEAHDSVIRERGELLVPMPCSRPNLSPGFHMFVHESPRAGHEAGIPEAVTRLYVRHLDPAPAVDDWARCVRALIDEGLDFRTKILSRTASYPRNDALVFYTSTDAEQVTAVVRGAAHRPERTGSPLTVPLGNGVYGADDPRDPRPAHRRRSFGEHRCHLLAAAIAAAGAAADDDLDLAALLRAECAAANVNADDIARNATSAVGTEGPT